ncbi:MAG: hypothetical protein IK049_04085, partial [Oscillospiraceae bacterium]|nr:hypothetical protein [Oscillospiraceae bacterium]
MPDRSADLIVKWYNLCVEIISTNDKVQQYRQETELDDRKKVLDRIKLFVLDMDGTFYLGEDLIPGSLEFLEAVKATGRDFIFFTNNSSKSVSLYIDKLNRMGCSIDRSGIMTSGDVTTEFLNTNRRGKTVYLMGTQALISEFEAAG